MEKFRWRPLLSVMMPTYNTPIEMLELAIRSVVKQHYKNWELCICDDASTDARVRECLRKWQGRDARLKVRFAERNEGIAGASNQALRMAAGEFVGLLDHDDELSANALYEVVKLLQEHPEADMIYSDEDRLDGEGRRVCPFFKPDWSPEYMLSVMYTCHFGVYRRRLMEEIGGFRMGFEGSQDYDLVLRISERTKNIFHVAKVLYHWRMAAGSAAASAEAKPYAYEAAKKALTEHLERRQIAAKAMDGELPSQYRIGFKIEGTEKISIVIAASGNKEALKNCIASIKEKSGYKNFEVIVVVAENGSGEEKAEKLGAQCVVRCPGNFDWTRMMNAGCRQASGKYLLLLSEDTEVISEEWLSSMLGVCQQKEIGAAGAKLLYRNGLIEHAGMVLGLKGVAGRPLHNFPRDTKEHFGYASSMRNCSAVSAACMMVRKEVFEEIGGFDEKVSAAYNDVDFCLAVRKAGYRVVWTPWAELYHDGAVPPENGRKSADIPYLKKRWGKLLENDPYYNPNLTLRHEDFGYRV